MLDGKKLAGWLPLLGIVSGFAASLWLGDQLRDHFLPRPSGDLLVAALYILGCALSIGGARIIIKKSWGRSAKENLAIALAVVTLLLGIATLRAAGSSPTGCDTEWDGRTNPADCG